MGKDVGRLMDQFESKMEWIQLMKKKEKMKTEHVSYSVTA
jgi:hypothetical protein